MEKIPEAYLAWNQGAIEAAHDKLRPEGFYRVRFDDRPGVAYLRHHADGGQPFEWWNILFLDGALPHLQPSIASISGRNDHMMARVKVGDPIEVMF